METKRIALVGAASTGKSTVLELLRPKLTGYQFVNESTRTIKKYGFPINEQGTNLTQLAISSFHLEALTINSSTVYDRCYLDLVVYSSLLDNISPEVLQYIEDTWNRVWWKYTHYIYFPIEFKAVSDGVRSVNEEWRNQTDEAFRKGLNKVGKYLTVTGSPIQRVRQITDYIQ